MNQAVFLDRDGVLIHLERVPGKANPCPPLRGDSVRLQAGVVDGLRLLRWEGFKLILVSNQPDAATGHNTLDGLREVHEAFVSLLTIHDATLDDYRYCLHHPDGVHETLSVDCDCRKPKPGLLLAAAEEHNIDLDGSWMVGDQHKDIAAGEAAGCQTIMVSTDYSFLNAAQQITREES